MQHRQKELIMYNEPIVAVSTIDKAGRSAQILRDIERFLSTGGEVQVCPAYTGKRLDPMNTYVQKKRVFAAIKAVYSRWQQDPEGVDPIAEVAKKLDVPKWKVAALFGRYMGGGK